VAYGCTLSALFEVMLRLGKWPQALSYVFAFWGYFFSFAALWFGMVWVTTKFLKSWFGAWLISTFGYFVWVYTGFFYFITGQWQGYGLALPLVMLMEQPALLGLLPYMHWWGMLVLVLVFQMCIARKRWGWGVVPLFFLAGSYFVGSNKGPEILWGQEVVVLEHPFIYPYSYERSYEIADLLRNASVSHHSAQVFVLPESAFPFPLNKHDDAVALWSSIDRIRQGYLIIGSHYLCVQQGGEHLHNSVYVLHQGRVIYRYDKTALLPFFEYPCGIAYSPFLEQKESFMSACSKSEGVILPGLDKVTFRVCSELLWDMPGGERVVALVHDGHYRYAYFPRLFRSFVFFKAFEKRSSVLYCGWKIGTFHH